MEEKESGQPSNDLSEETPRIRKSARILIPVHNVYPINKGQAIIIDPEIEDKFCEVRLSLFECMMEFFNRHTEISDNINKAKKGDKYFNIKEALGRLNVTRSLLSNNPVHPNLALYTTGNELFLLLRDEIEEFVKYSDLYFYIEI